MSISSIRTIFTATALVLLLPGLALAEGAVRVLACKTTQRCDAAGVCKPDSSEVSFRLTPVTLQPDGSGQYMLRYGDTEHTMQAQSEAGPFLWTQGSERHTLLASSETRFLWHRLTLQPQPAATIDFMACTFRQ